MRLAAFEPHQQPEPLVCGLEHDMPDFDDSEKVPALGWRIKQLETRQERDSKDIRDHIDKCMKEIKQHVDEELKEIREANEKRIARIETFIIRALILVATPVVVGLVALVVKNPPTGG